MAAHTEAVSQYEGATHAAANALSDQELANRLTLLINDGHRASDAERRAWLTVAAARLRRHQRDALDAAVAATRASRAGAERRELVGERVES